MHQNNPDEKLKNVSRSIRDSDKSLKHAEKEFHREAANIVKENIKVQ